MEFIEWIADALGVNRQAPDLGTLQMVLRACVVYVFMRPHRLERNAQA